MELKILAIDTSNHPMSIALVEDDRLMAQTTLNMVRNHSVYVLPTIERLMDDLGWTPTDLNRVVVANGPVRTPGSGLPPRRPRFWPRRWGSTWWLNQA